MSRKGILAVAHSTSSEDRGGPRRIFFVVRRHQRFVALSLEQCQCRGVGRPLFDILRSSELGCCVLLSIHGTLSSENALAIAVT